MDPLTFNFSLAYMPSFNRLIWPIIGSIYELALKFAHSYVFRRKMDNHTAGTYAEKLSFTLSSRYLFHASGELFQPSDRHTHPNWSLSLVDNCRTKGVFFKPSEDDPWQPNLPPKPFPTENWTMHREGIIEFLRPLKLVRIVFQRVEEVLRR